MPLEYVLAGISPADGKNPLDNNHISIIDRVYIRGQTGFLEQVAYGVRDLINETKRDFFYYADSFLSRFGYQRRYPDREMSGAFDNSPDIGARNISYREKGGNLVNIIMMNLNIFFKSFKNAYWREYAKMNLLHEIMHGYYVKKDTPMGEKEVYSLLPKIYEYAAANTWGETKKIYLTMQKIANALYQEYLKNPYEAFEVSLSRIYEQFKHEFGDSKTIGEYLASIKDQLKGNISSALRGKLEKMKAMLERRRNGKNPKGDKKDGKGDKANKGKGNNSKQAKGEKKGNASTKQESGGKRSGKGVKK